MLGGYDDLFNKYLYPKNLTEISWKIESELAGGFAFVDFLDDILVVTPGHLSSSACRILRG